MKAVCGVLDYAGDVDRPRGEKTEVEQWVWIGVLAIVLVLLEIGMVTAGLYAMLLVLSPGAP